MPHKNNFNEKILLPAAVIFVLVILTTGCDKLGGNKSKGSNIPDIYTGVEGVDAVELAAVVG